MDSYDRDDDEVTAEEIAFVRQNIDTELEPDEEETEETFVATVCRPVPARMRRIPPGGMVGAIFDGYKEA